MCRSFKYLIYLTPLSKDSRLPTGIPARIITVYVRQTDFSRNAETVASKGTRCRESGLRRDTTFRVTCRKTVALSQGVVLCFIFFSCNC